jgi:hypothetical protein
VPVLFHKVSVWVSPQSLQDPTYRHGEKALCPFLNVIRIFELACHLGVWCCPMSDRK